jgi:hypothetical protein
MNNQNNTLKESSLLNDDMGIEAITKRIEALVEESYKNTTTSKPA